ncbi:MAG: SH3 domain-containing protein [Treponema sp.]|nr:SH3 domain-containing protein [Treponema sp.]
MFNSNRYIFIIFFLFFVIACSNKKNNQNDYHETQDLVTKENIQQGETKIVEADEEEPFFFYVSKPIKYMKPIFDSNGEVIDNKEIESNQNFCIIKYEDNSWNSIWGASNEFSHILKVETNRIIEIYIETSTFVSKGQPSFWDWNYPKTVKIKIDDDLFLKIKSSIDTYNYLINYNDLFFSESVNVLVICDNLRVREDPNMDSSTKVIGKLKKWDKMIAIDCTETKETIENLEYPWYKIRLKDGTEGWVFGGFAKIYFDDKDLELLYKAFEKEGSEYTNQFLTSDES